MSHRHQMNSCVRMLEKEYFKNGLNQLEATVSSKLLQFTYCGCITLFYSYDYCVIRALCTYLYTGDKDRVACGDDNRRPPVPKATDHIATPYRTRRSFVNKNAMDAMLSEPSRIEDPQFVDAPKGNVQSKINSGMMPNFIEKPKFGKVPGYLKRRKQEQVEDQKRWEEEQDAIVKRKEMMKLQDHERQSILDVSIYLVALI